MPTAGRWEALCVRPKVHSNYSRSVFFPEGESFGRQESWVDSSRSLHVDAVRFDVIPVDLVTMPGSVEIVTFTSRSTGSQMII